MDIFDLILYFLFRVALFFLVVMLATSILTDYSISAEEIIYPSLIMGVTYVLYNRKQ